jgi:hypothetical protein
MAEKHLTLSSTVFGVIFALFIAQIGYLVLIWNSLSYIFAVNIIILLGITFIKAVHYWEHYNNFFIKYPLTRFRHYLIDYTICLIGALSIIFVTNILAWFLLIGLLHLLVTLRCKATISKVKKKDSNKLLIFIKDNYRYYLPCVFGSALLILLFGSVKILYTLTVTEICVYATLILHIFRSYVWYKRD